MAPAPHLTEALREAQRLASGADGEPGWKALEAQASRVLRRLDAEAADPGHVEVSESEGPVGGDLDPDAVDRAVASITALREQPDDVQLDIAIAALTDLEDALPDAPGPGSHPGR